MKTYSIPRNIWRAVYPLLIFIAIPAFVGAAAGAIYSANLVISDIGAITDTDMLTEQLEQWATKYTLLLSLIGQTLCLAPFLPIWLSMRKSIPRYQEEPRPIKMFACLMLGFVGFNLLLSSIVAITGIDRFFPSYEEIMAVLTGSNIVVRVLFVVVAAPIIEEICFRGIILGRLLSWTKAWVAVLIQAALFGIAHFNLLQGLYTFVIGIAFGLLYVRFRTLWMCIIGHFAFNLPGFILSLIEEGGVDIAPWVILIPGVILFAAGGYFLLKHPVAVPVEAPRTDAQLST